MYSGGGGGIPIVPIYKQKPLSLDSCVREPAAATHGLDDMVDWCLGGAAASSARQAHAHVRTYDPPTLYARRRRRFRYICIYVSDAVRC